MDNTYNSRGHLQLPVQLVPITTKVVRIPFMGCVQDKALCDKVCQLLVVGPWCCPVSSTTNGHDITEILLKVVLSKNFQYRVLLQIIQYFVMSEFV